MWAIVHLKHPAHQVGISPKPALPVFVTKHQDGVGLGVFIARNKRPAIQWPDTQNIEKVSGNHRGAHPLRSVLSEQQKHHAMVLHHSIQGMILAAIVENFLYRERDVVDVRQRRLLVQHHQLTAALVWQRPQQDAINHAEDRRIHSDANRQRNDRRGRESRILPQSSKPVANILQHGFEKMAEPCVPALVLELFDSAQSQAGLAARLFLRHSALEILLYEMIEMKTKLGVERLLSGLSSQEITNGANNLVKHVLALYRPEYASDGPRHPRPTFTFFTQLPAAQLGQRVVFGLPVVLARGPFGADPSGLFQPVQRRVERALIHLQHALGHLLDPLRNAAPMHGLEVKGL